MISRGNNKYMHLALQFFDRVLLIFLNWFVIHIDYPSNPIGHKKIELLQNIAWWNNACLSNKMHHIWNINIVQAFDQEEVISCAISNIIQHIRSVWQSFQQRKNRRSKAEITQIYYLHMNCSRDWSALNVVNITALCDSAGQYWWVSYEKADLVKFRRYIWGEIEST